MLHKLKPETQQKVIKLYADAFKDADCHRCVAHCCSGCADSRGYLKDKDFREVKEYYTLETGFLGPKGCRLPLEKRSGLCVGWMCGNPNGRSRQSPPVNGKYSTNMLVNPKDMHQWTEEERQAANQIRSLFISESQY